jgi:hypothetical protein
VDKDSLQAPAPRASGTLESHYAPRAKVRLMSPQDIAAKLLALGPTLEVLKNPDVQKAYLGSFDDLEVAA